MGANREQEGGALWGTKSGKENRTRCRTGGVFVAKPEADKHPPTKETENGADVERVKKIIRKQFSKNRPHIVASLELKSIEENGAKEAEDDEDKKS